MTEVIFMTLTKHEQDELIQLRRFFHQNPECSMQETKTASFIENELQKCGLSVKRIGKTGIYAGRCRGRSTKQKGC